MACRLAGNGDGRLPGRRSTDLGAIAGGRHERTWRDLLASARKLFTGRGYRAASAASAGVTERTLFRYFPNKLAPALDELVPMLPEMARFISATGAAGEDSTGMRTAG
jgi:AcrR family transcriptional regulator